MTIFLFASCVGIFLQLLGYSNYYRELLWKKRARPHIFTWILWAILSGIGLSAQISEGETWGIIPILIAFLHCSAITVLALWYGEKNITAFDTKILVLGLSAIPLWIITKTPLYSVLLISFVEAIAWLPTFRKSWENPMSEPILGPFLSGFSYILGLFLLQEINIITSFFQISMIFLNWTAVACILWRRKQCGNFQFLP